MGPDSLTDAVRKTTEVLLGKTPKMLHLTVDLPDRVPGYSNNYILAVLLPLIENAIEASTTSSPLDIRLADSGTQHVFEVINTSATPPASNDIYRPGVTTKPNHDGTGLTIVQNLLANYPGADISYESTGNIVTFRVRLPRETDHDS